MIHHAFGIAEFGVEDVIGFAFRKAAFRDGDKGVRLDIQRVAQHHIGEGGGDVGDCHVGEPLKSGGGLSVDGGAFIPRQPRVRRVGRVVESVVSAARFGGHQNVRTVFGFRVCAHHDVRRVGEGDGVERFAHFLDGGVFERLQNLCAVFVDVEHLAEFEGGDFVGRARNGGYRFARDYLHCGVRRADVHAHPSFVSVVEAGVVRGHGSVCKTVVCRGHAVHTAVIRRFRDVKRQGREVDFALRHRDGARKHRVVQGDGKPFVRVDFRKREHSVGRKHEAAFAVGHKAVEISLCEKFRAFAVDGVRVVDFVNDVTVERLVVCRRVERGRVAGIVDGIGPVAVCDIAQLAVDEPVVVRSRDIRFRPVRYGGRRKFVRGNFFVAVRADVQRVFALREEEVAVRVRHHAHGEIVHHVRKRIERRMAQGRDEVVFSEGKPEVLPDGVDGHIFVVYGAQYVVQCDVDVVVEVFVDDGKFVASEIHFEEFAHVAQRHIVDDVAEMVGHFLHGVVEQHGNVNAADFLGDFQTVILTEFVYGQSVEILQVADERLNEFEHGHFVDVVFVVENVRAQRVFKLTDADETARGENHADDGDYEQDHTHYHTDNEI